MESSWGKPQINLLTSFMVRLKCAHARMMGEAWDKLMIEVDEFNK
jgi:hypothetical protein